MSRNGHLQTVEAPTSLHITESGCYGNDKMRMFPNFKNSQTLFIYIYQKGN